MHLPALNGSGVVIQSAFTFLDILILPSSFSLLAIYFHDFSLLTFSRVHYTPGLFSEFEYPFARFDSGLFEKQLPIFIYIFTQLIHGNMYILELFFFSFHIFLCFWAGNFLWEAFRHECVYTNI